MPKLTTSKLTIAEAIYYHFYQRRRRAAQMRSTPAPCKIVSVGNITTGGTGKTPAVQFVARLLQEHGTRVAVVARGYGARLSGTGAVVSDGATIFLNATDAGDEPLLHARSLPGVAVLIGRDRAAAAQRAMQEFGAQIVVLDDAFQYWSLPRDFDLVLLDARRPFGNGRLLPRGRLREPPSCLERADAVLLTRAALASATQRANARTQIERFTTAPIFAANHEPVALRDEASGQNIELASLQSLPILAVSALAHNSLFAATLAGCGARILSHLERRDHHRWKAAELQQVAAHAARLGARVVVTTEKDAVKIAPDATSPLPLWSLSIELRLGAEYSAFSRLILDKLNLQAS
ncbi:MAG TPA: tetraacyldisaccharide 4'-kinase [Abditibacteriaceae bacterium]|nr:tetraacyldisaccharide 4'-kinase [Abditibacteriaceae bacterium]